MEHVEDVLFDAERKLQRRYPSRATKIAATTKELWHRDGVGVFYCAHIMAKAIGLSVEAVQPFYTAAEHKAFYREQQRQQRASDLRRRVVWIVWGAVVLAGAVLVVVW